MRRRKPIPADYTLPASFDFTAFDQFETTWNNRSGWYRFYFFLALFISVNALCATIPFFIYDVTFSVNAYYSFVLSWLVGTTLTIYPLSATLVFSEWLYSKFLAERLIPYELNTTAYLVAAYRKDLAEWNYLNLETGEGFWKSLRGAAFEDALARLFQRRGFSVEKTKTTGDGGIDLILRSGSDLIFVQCKGYAKPVPVAPIREIAGVCSRSQAGPVVAAVNGFTKGAIECARELNVTLVDTPGIVRMAALDHLDKSSLRAVSSAV